MCKNRKAGECLRNDNLPMMRSRLWMIENSTRQQSGYSPCSSTGKSQNSSFRKKGTCVSALWQSQAPFRISKMTTVRTHHTLKTFLILGSVKYFSQKGLQVLA